jgi:hypothetical protein
MPVSVTKANIVPFGFGGDFQQSIPFLRGTPGTEWNTLIIRMFHFLQSTSS